MRHRFSDRPDKVGIVARGVGVGAKITDGMAVREQHGHTTTWHHNEPPDAVVFAQSTEDVQRIVTVCAKRAVPVIPFGTGTSLEAHVNAPLGGIS